MFVGVFAGVFNEVFNGVFRALLGTLAATSNFEGVFDVRAVLGALAATLGASFEVLDVTTLLEASAGTVDTALGVGKAETSAALPTQAMITAWEYFMMRFG